MMLSLDTAYRSFGGEVEASSTPTICRLSDSRRHQLSAIAPSLGADSTASREGAGQVEHPTCHYWAAFEKGIVAPKAQVLGSKSCRLEVEMSFNKARHCKPSDGLEYGDEEVAVECGWFGCIGDGRSRVGSRSGCTSLHQGSPSDDCPY